MSTDIILANVSAARYQRAKAVANRRASESRCALDFLRLGDTIGFHAKRCVFGEADPCAREYDPRPEGTHAPDPREYEGTGIGALYGYDHSDHHSWQLAGWNVRRRRDTA